MLFMILLIKTGLLYVLNQNGLPYHNGKFLLFLLNVHLLNFAAKFTRKNQPTPKNFGPK